MNDQEFKNKIDYIGSRLMGAFILSSISLIWIRNPISWKVFFTVVVLLAFCLVFRFAVEDKIKRGTK